MEIRTAAGVRLAPLPMIRNPDYMAGEDGRIYTRLRHKGFGRWKYVEWHPVGGARRQRSRTVVIDLDGHRMALALARVICASFHGMPSDESGQVRHLDGDPDNNRADNLAWGTEQEVWADLNAHRQEPGHRRVRGRLSGEERAHLRWALAVGLCSQRQAARTLGLALSTVQAVVHEGRGARSPEPGPEQERSREAAAGDDPGEPR